MEKDTGEAVVRFARERAIARDPRGAAVALMSLFEGDPAAHLCASRLVYLYACRAQGTWPLNAQTLDLLPT